MDDFVEGFITDCEARGLTAHTIQTYQGCVKSFLQANPEPSRVDLDVLRRYLKHLRSMGLQGSTLKGYFAALSTFYDYLIFEGILSSNPVLPFRKRYLTRIKRSTGGENTRQLISVQQMRVLILAAEHIQDVAILLFLAKSGLRRQEFLDIRLSDLFLENGIIFLIPKSKRSQRTIFVDDELAEVLKKYLSWRSRVASSPWLWINRDGKTRGKKLDRDYPGMLIASLAQPMGLHDPKGPLCSRLTPHCLRHFFTTHLFRAGLSPIYIKWLRGDSPGKEAWEQYNHIDPENVRAEYLRRIPKLICSVLLAAGVPQGDRTEL